MNQTKTYKLLYLLLILIHMIGTGCEREVPSKLQAVDCYDCFEVRPDSGKLIVTVTINDENPFVPLVIYKGNIDDENFEFVDTTYSEEYWVRVPVNNYYSIAAEYKSGDKTIFAVDGDDFKIKYTDSDCNYPCYYYYGGYYDIQLRY